MGASRLRVNVKCSFTLYNCTTIRYNNIQTRRNPRDTFRPFQVITGEAFKKEKHNNGIHVMCVQWERYDREIAMGERLRTEQNVYRSSCLTAKLVFTMFYLCLLCFYSYILCFYLYLLCFVLFVLCILYCFVYVHLFLLGLSVLV